MGMRLYFKMNDNTGVLFAHHKIDIHVGITEGSFWLPSDDAHVLLQTTHFWGEIGEDKQQ